MLTNVDFLPWTLLIFQWLLGVAASASFSVSWWNTFLF